MDYKMTQLTMQDICDTFHELDLEVKEEHISRPTAQRTVLLLHCLVCLFTPNRYLSLEEVRKKVKFLFPTTDNLFVVDLLIVFQFFQDFLTSIGYTDITRQDLTTPTGQKLYRMLSYVAHYSRFSDQCWFLFEPISSMATALGEDLDELSRSREECERMMQDLQQAETTQRPQVRQLQSQESDLEHEIQEERLRVQSLDVAARELKAERKELKDRMQSTHYDSMEELAAINEVQRLANLDGLALKEHTASAKPETEAIRLRKQDQLKRHALVKTEYDDGKVYNDKLIECLDKWKDVHSSLDLTNRTRKTMDHLTSEYEDLLTIEKALEYELYTLQRQVAENQLKIKRIDDQQEKKRISHQAFLDDFALQKPKDLDVLQQNEDLVHSLSIREMESTQMSQDFEAKEELQVDIIESKFKIILSKVAMKV